MMPLVPMRLVCEQDAAPFKRETQIFMNSILTLLHGKATAICMGQIHIFAQHTETAPPTGGQRYTSAFFSLSLYVSY